MPLDAAPGGGLLSMRFMSAGDMVLFTLQPMRLRVAVNIANRESTRRLYWTVGILILDLSGNIGNKLTAELRPHIVLRLVNRVGLGSCWRHSFYMTVSKGKVSFLRVHGSVGSVRPVGIVGIGNRVGRDGYVRNLASRKAIPPVHAGEHTAGTEVEQVARNRVDIRLQDVLLSKEK